MHQEVLNILKRRSLLHPEPWCTILMAPFGRGASGHTVYIQRCTKRLEKQHLLNKLVVFQVALILFFIFLPFFYSCENKITLPEKVINQPGNVEAYGFDNKITVKFYGNNIEEGFQGYNVYISKTPGIAAQNIEPVLNSFQTKPTLLYGSVGCFPYASEKSYVSLTNDSSKAKITNNNEYFVAVSAYVLIGSTEDESPLTEEVSVRVSKKTNVILNVNDNYLNNEFTYTTNSVGLPLLSTTNSIQDVGYVADMDEYNYIPVSGYILDGSLAAIDGHLYILNSNGKHIKIYVERVFDTKESIELWVIPVD